MFKIQNKSIIIRPFLVFLFWSFKFRSFEFVSNFVLRISDFQGCVGFFKTLTHPWEAPKGYDLRKELIHHFNDAFRDKSSLIRKVKEIANNSSLEGMIDGLYDLNVLGLVNQELLRKIGFDFTLLDLAAQKSNDLAMKKEAASFDSEDYLEAKKIRDQAYTHLKEAVDYILEYGRYVFWTNPARLKGYRSEYRRRLKQRSTRRNRVPEPEPGYVPVTVEV